MRFTGKNLDLVHSALIGYRYEVHNMIVTAPEDEIGGESYKAYESEHLAIERMLDKIAASGEKA